MKAIAPRIIRQIVDVEEVMEGAGVLVRRALPTDQMDYSAADPFLLLDDAELPTDPNAPGFPPHPHRGFEIVTYLLSGEAGHTDNSGRRTVVKAGGLQRITTGSGIWHGEDVVPSPSGETPRGLQMWINLARKNKTLKPDYQIVEPQDVPEESINGVKVRRLAGDGTKVPLHTPAFYLDVHMPAAKEFEWQIPEDYQGFAYVYEGEGTFGAEGDKGHQGQLLNFGQGGPFKAKTTGKAARFILAAGHPHREPIHWRGPFVD